MHRSGTFKFLEEMSYARARETISEMRKSVRLAWHRRWVRLLAVSAARAWALSVVQPDDRTMLSVEDGPDPEVSDVLGESRR